ncbi:xanthine dehydrogenase family protein molybdopterin-binding subunit [Streptomyces flaveus]|uniref:Xanthine dehydrogenase n=1 Tax=Streptomyces flaveus TaxID=66370 RepID=A0A917RPV0_9ACTN|nr:xanthine dehydrogenase family protein molybdopterin-binding subunit [Streptomyces flaveus]GGL18272.1 xanthine dehydrogenase [Streptomyces flaveus]
MKNPDLRRVDAHEKVTGTARYGADRVPDDLAYAMFASATIGKGRTVAIDTAAAEAVPGVRLVLTRFNEDELRGPGFLMGGGFAFQSLQPLLSDVVAYRGQPIALIVADTLVAATEAAELVRARYDTEPFAVGIDDEGATSVLQEEAIPLPWFADVKVGDAETAYAASPVQIDETYLHPAQHQVPIELISSVVEWQGDRLVVHESTQNAGALRHGVATQLNLDPADVDVISPYIGGGFGSRNALQPHIGPLALAARRLMRPVKLVIPRPQTFHTGSFRPVSRHRIRLGADPSGRLLAALHDTEHQTSRHDLFPAMYTEMTSRLYAVPNFGGRQSLVQTDVQTPGYMRAPHEGPAGFAFESAIDALAYATGQDPVELRLANDTATDPVTGLPFSSRHLAQCLKRGAERFGWEKRDPRPGSMRAADGSFVGLGVAAGAYPVMVAPAVARMSAAADGRVTVGVDGHEMGQGIRSAIALLVAEDLGVPVQDVVVRVGDTRFAPQHLTAGSWGTATALPAVHKALRELRKQLGTGDTGTVDVAAAVRATGHGSPEVEVTSLGQGQPSEMLDRSRAGLTAPAGPVFPDFTAFSWVAHFVEVRVEATTRRISVPRALCVADCGRVASPVTAASQVRGGVIWGISQALRESSEVDPRFGGFLNTTLEEYPVAVNADIQGIDVDFIDEPDLLLNDVGVKGLGEVTVVGVAAAVANAVFHATGQRQNRLPIRIEHVM